MKYLFYIFPFFVATAIMPNCSDGDDGNNEEKTVCNDLKKIVCESYGEESERCADAMFSIIQIKNELSYEQSDTACKAALENFIYENDPDITLPDSCVTMAENVCACSGATSIYCDTMYIILDKLTAAGGAGVSQTCDIGLASYDCKKPHYCREYLFDFCNCSKVTEDECNKAVFNVEIAIDKSGIEESEIDCENYFQQLQVDYPDCAK